MKISLWKWIILAMFVLSGCNKPEPLPYYSRKPDKTTTDKTKLPSVENIPLTDIIIKPKGQKLSVKRDPFEPLIKPKVDIVDARVLELQQEEDLLMGMRYVGVVKFGEAFSALMHTEDGKGVYQVNDQVNGLTITKIDESSITFTKGNKILKLQRGDL
jgi:hypothetical protein